MHVKITRDKLARLTTCNGGWELYEDVGDVDVPEWTLMHQMMLLAHPEARKYWRWLVSENFIPELSMEGLDLRGVDLRDADLYGANLRATNLRYAKMLDADLSCSDLSCSNLRDADLRYADLRGAKLRDADLSCAKTDGVIW